MTKEITYGPTHTRMLQILGDGEPHTQKELMEVCGNPNRKTSSSTLMVHISILRDKLAKEDSNGFTLYILPIYKADRPSYRLVRLAPATLKDIKSLAVQGVSS